MTEQPLWTETEVRSCAARAFHFSRTAASLEEREPALHRFLDRECSRTHHPTDGYAGSNHFRTYLAVQDLYTTGADGSPDQEPTP